MKMFQATSLLVLTYDLTGELEECMSQRPCPDCGGTGRVFTPEVVARRLERSLKRAGRERRERQMAIRLHPEVALYLLEEAPRLIHTLGKMTGLELELRDDPMMRVDEFRLMSRPAGRDVTDIYAVA